MTTPIEGENGPLSDRLVHKVWKIRLAAYEELEKLFKDLEEPNDPKFSEYGSLWKNIISDSNAAAQEKGLDALLAFLDRAKEAPKHAPLVCGLLVEKCLGGREKTKNKAVEAFLLCIEIEAVEPAITSLVKGCTHKVPKICVASLFTLKEIIRLFGIKPLPIKLIFTSLVSFFDHADGSVRDEAFALTVELHRWLGQALKPQIEKLRPAQIKDLEAAFEEAKAKGPPRPERYLRSQQATMFASAMAAQAEPATQEVDPYDMMEPVNILSQIKEEWFENVVSPKWQIRKEQLEALITLASVPRLQPGDYSEVTKVLKKLLGDANVIVVSKVAIAIGLLAKGLRKDYSALAKQVLPTLLDKFKEKKNVVVDAIHQTLDTMYSDCFTLQDVIEEIVATQENKVPKVRQDTLSWITRCLKNTKTVPKRTALSKVVKPLANFILTALDDGSPDVRDAAAITFGNLIGSLGERVLQPYLGKLDKIKLDKVKQHVPEMPAVAAAPPPVDSEPPKIDLSDLNDDSNDNSESQPKAKKAPAKATKKSAPAPKASSSDDRDSESPPPTTTKKSAPKQATKPAAKSSAKAASAPAKKTKEPSKASNDIGTLMSTEEAIEKFEQMFPASSVSGLASSNWKERLAAIQEISEHIDKIEKSSEVAEILVRQFSTKPGWKESNFQVMNGMLGVMAKLSQNDAMSKAAIVAVIPGLVEKISDAKIKPAAVECLTAFSEFDSHQFVMSQLYIHTSKHKSPKVIVETETWISSAIEEFGLNGIQVKDLIDYLRECLESTNPQVKTQAIKTLVVLRKFVGPGLRDFLNDIKPALLTTIDDEFDKVGNEKPASPTRTCRGLKPSGKSSSGGGNSAASNSNDILPREDISSKITPGIIKKLSDSNWKLRKEALEEIQQLILSANKRIQPTLASLLSALKGHINESNKPVATATMELLSLIATATGPAIDKQAKLVVPTLLSNFADNNKHIRDTAAQCLDVWVAETTLEPFIPLIATPLLETVPARKELLQWLTKHWSSFVAKAPKSVDMNPLVKPLVTCLEDKTSDVRNLSQQFLKDVAKNVGTEAIRKQTTDLKQASKLVLAPILEALKAEEAQQKKEQANKPKTNAVPAKEDKSKPDGLLNCNNSKQSRLAQDSQVKWSTDSPGSELYDLLSEQMSTPSTIGANLRDQLLSSDSKQQTEAITSIVQFATTEHTQQVSDNLDMLLKWVSLRLYDGGLPMILKCLEMLQSLLSLLSQNNYQMLDLECDVILRSLVEKLSHNDEKIRKLSQDILKLLCQLYPVTKLAKLLVEYSLESTNTATRSSSLVSLASMISTQSVDFASLCNNKSFASLSQLIGSNDSALNTAVVEVFRNLHKHIGEDLWQYLPQDQRSLIQEAITNGSNPSTNSKIPKPKTSARNNNEESPNLFKLDLDLELPSVNINAFDSTAVMVPDTLSTSHSSLMRTSSLTYLASDTNNSPLGASNLTPQADLLSSAPTLIENIQSNDIPRVIECLKVLCLAADEVLIVLSSDKLIHALTQQLNKCYLMDSTDAAASYRLMKYLLNTLHKLFSIVTIAKSLSLETLKPLLSQLIQSLTDKKLSQYEDGKYLSKALNLLIMKITDTIDTSSAFTILIRCLSESIPAPNAVSSNPKFTELVMKCLLRLGKSLGSTIHSINLDFLFRDIHQFLEAHPPSSWKGRDDMPLRTIKTILNEVVTLKGNQVYNHLTMVPVQPTPAITSYIDLMLKSQSSSKESISSAEVKTILSEIFKKIGSKDATYQGLMELYQFKKSHPTVDLVPHLQRTSQHFQEYIKKGLETIELQHQVENRDPNLRSSANFEDDTQKSTKKAEPISSTTNTSLQDLKARLKAAQVTSAPTTTQTNPTSQQTQPGPAQTSSSSVDALRERLARLKAQTTS